MHCNSKGTRKTIVEAFALLNAKNLKVDGLGRRYHMQVLAVRNVIDIQGSLSASTCTSTCTVDRRNEISPQVLLFLVLYESARVSGWSRD